MRLGGYNILEMDYDCRLMQVEMELRGGVDLRVIPHNLMGYQTLRKSAGLSERPR